MPSASPSRVLILATGGTIAGEATSSTSVHYTSGKSDIATLLAAAQHASSGVSLKAEQIANVGSQDMDASIWMKLHSRILEAFSRDQADAIVVTHGTDTLEETSFLLDLTLPAGRTLVFVGAMRPANVLSADGPRNLANAIRVATDPNSRDRGVLVVTGDVIYSVRDVYKASTVTVDAFKGYPQGPIGQVRPSSVRFFTQRTHPAWSGSFPFPAGGKFPSVAIIQVYSNMEPQIAEAILKSGIEGVILSGVGHGNAPAWLLMKLAAAAKAGLAVVRSSQVPEGAAVHNLEVEDDASEFVVAGDLSPRKSRILLQLSLASGRRSLSELRNAFAEFGHSR